jgi:hypothetical protein
MELKVGVMEGGGPRAAGNVSGGVPPLERARTARRGLLALPTALPRCVGRARHSRLRRASAGQAVRAAPSGIWKNGAQGTARPTDGGVRRVGRARHSVRAAPSGIWKIGAQGTARPTIRTIGEEPLATMSFLRSVKNTLN